VLRIRDDDILVPSSSWSNPFERFKEIHEWIVPHQGRVVHVPTILVAELQMFPECIAYIKENVANGTMEPQIHGFHHIDYSRLRLPKDRVPDRGAVDLRLFNLEELNVHFRAVQQHIATSKEWISNHFGAPDTWYTPWGADNPLLRKVAESLKLKLVGVDKKSFLQHVGAELRDGKTTVDEIKDRELFIHWWDRGRRVLRMCLAVEYGSWAEAEKARPDAFKE